MSVAVMVTGAPGAVFRTLTVALLVGAVPPVLVTVTWLEVDDQVHLCTVIPAGRFVTLASSSFDSPRPRDREAGSMTTSGSRVEPEPLSVTGA